MFTRLNFIGSSFKDFLVLWRAVIECPYGQIFITQAFLFPVKNLSSQLTHWERTLKLMVGSFWGHSVSSQWTYKMSSYCELAWAFCEFATQTVSSLLPLHGELIGMISRIAHSKLMVWVANSLKVHCKLTVWAHLESSLWANWVSSKRDNSGELSVSMVLAHTFTG